MEITLEIWQIIMIAAIVLGVIGAIQELNKKYKND